ncbi:hypothetical protein V8F20_012405 [Naviculisporaceae sp. PSN 640]
MGFRATRHGGAIDPRTGLPTVPSPSPARHGGAIDPRTGLPITPSASPGSSTQPYHAGASSPVIQQPYSSPASPQPVQQEQQYTYFYQAQGQPQQADGPYNYGSRLGQQEKGGFMTPVATESEVPFQSGVLVAAHHSQDSSNHNKIERFEPRPPRPGPPGKVFPTTLKRWKHNFSSLPGRNRKPGWVYRDTNKYRHRDSAGRVTILPRSDQYLSHIDGRLCYLHVQCTDDIFEAPGNATWSRTYIRKVSPLKARAATWVIDFSYDPESWKDWGVMILRAFPAAIAMTLCFWDLTEAKVENNGCYAPVPAAFWGTAKVWGNGLENKKGLSELATNHQTYHTLKPRHLCFLNNPESDQPYGVTVRAVEEWKFEEKGGREKSLDYLFVAFSGEQFPSNSPEDMMALIQMAEHACREAKLPAFWISSHCMLETSENQVDVYRIADILRGAQRMAIVVGPSAMSTKKRTNTDTDALLRQWGSRMWTFPEVLLCPGHSIRVYNRAMPNSPLSITKNQFAGRVWADSGDVELSSQLIEHYNGTLALSRLELAILLLKCLFARQTHTWFAGDHSYALMGLLRLRPQIDGTDSPFQAFARISLANDSDNLLERAICILPTSPTQPFYDFSDVYKSELWDITPTCQVAAICDNDTGATKLMEFQFVFFIVGIVLSTSRQVAPGVILLLVYFVLWLWTPNIVRLSLGGKLTNVQAALFGFEGYLNAPTVERAIFGGNFDRLGWSTNRSPLSRSYINEFGERVGEDPCTADIQVRNKIEKAKHGKALPGQMRIFTLVDTYNMQMTLFEAERPPSCVVLCGAEGGMRRAVACSYDFTTSTMYRETVLRMPTTSLNRMDRVPRFRFGLRRPEEGFELRRVVATEV